MGELVNPELLVAELPRINSSKTGIVGISNANAPFQLERSNLLIHLHPVK